LFSQASPAVTLSQEQIESLTQRVQYGGDEVVKAKDGAGSATLSMAHAGARFANSLLSAMLGKNTFESAYVNLEADHVNGSAVRQETGCDYFATKIELGVSHFSI
jgi:malate dehydrogenase